MNDPLDPGTLASIEEMVGGPKLGEIIERFLEHAPGRLSSFLAAAREGDLESAGAALHSLRSSASMLGALRLRDEARRLEQLVYEGDQDTLRGDAPGLTVYLDDASQALELTRRNLGRGSGD